MGRCTFVAFFTQFNEAFLESDTLRRRTISSYESRLPSERPSLSKKNHRVRRALRALRSLLEESREARLAPLALDEARPAPALARPRPRPLLRARHAPRGRGRGFGSAVRARPGVGRRRARVAPAAAAFSVLPPLPLEEPREVARVFLHLARARSRALGPLERRPAHRRRHRVPPEGLVVQRAKQRERERERRLRRSPMFSSSVRRLRPRRTRFGRRCGRRRAGSVSVFSPLIIIVALPPPRTRTHLARAHPPPDLLVGS